jgi:hypothetical protein
MSERKTVTVDLATTLRLAVGDDLKIMAADAYDLIGIAESEVDPENETVG